MVNQEVTPATIRMSAMNLLALREHSAKELLIKLAKKFTQTDWIASEVEKLKADGLQSDRRFTEAYINMRLRQGKGSTLIRLELKEKGVADSIINEFIAAGVDWNLLALQAYKKKFGNKLIPNLKERSRRIRFLTARGFSAANVQYALRHNSLEDDDLSL